MASLCFSLEMRTRISATFLALWLLRYCEVTSAQGSPPVTTSGLPPVDISSWDPALFQHPPTLSYLNAKPDFKTFTRLLNFPIDKKIPGSFAVDVIKGAKMNITVLAPVEAAWTALGNAVTCLDSINGYTLTDKILRNHILIGAHNATELGLQPGPYPTVGNMAVTIARLPTGITANGVNIAVPEKSVTFGGVILNLDRVMVPEDFQVQWTTACPSVPISVPPPTPPTAPASGVVPPITVPGAVVPGAVASGMGNDPTIPPPSATPPPPSASAGGDGGSSVVGEGGFITNRTEAGAVSSPTPGSATSCHQGITSTLLKASSMVALVWAASSL